MDFKTKLEYHHQLNPALWDKDSLKKEVKDKLDIIADEFLKELDITDIKVKDIVLTGSNTNYNWTELSDVDMHFILKDGLDMDKMNAIKSLWNEKHDVTIKGFSVEVYVEDSSVNQSDDAGLYSLKHNKWLREPKFENIKFDYDKIKEKSEKWMKKIDKVINSSKNELDKAVKIFDKIKSSRHAALAKGGEFCMENLVFKSLRNNKYIDKLASYIARMKDEKLSLK